MNKMGRECRKECPRQLDILREKGLEKFVSNFESLVGLANLAQPFSVLSEQDFSTYRGKWLFWWLHETLNHSPFGISYISEGPEENKGEGQEVEVELEKGEIHKTTLYAVAGIYSFKQWHQNKEVKGHYKDITNVAAFSEGLVALFKDAIKVYSFTYERLHGPAGGTWQSHFDFFGDYMRHAVRTSPNINDPDETKEMKLPLFYATEDSSFLDPYPGYFKELDQTGFPASIGGHKTILCSTDLNNIGR